MHYYRIRYLRAPDVATPGATSAGAKTLKTEKPWLRTNGVNTNGAAAKVMNFDRVGRQVHPGPFGMIKVGERECAKSPSVEKHENCSDPISSDPICPFPKAQEGEEAHDEPGEPVRCLPNLRICIAAIPPGVHSAWYAENGKIVASLLSGGQLARDPPSLELMKAVGAWVQNIRDRLKCTMRLHEWQLASWKTDVITTVIYVHWHSSRCLGVLRITKWQDSFECWWWWVAACWYPM